jgi:hypothetical protein
MIYGVFQKIVLGFARCLPGEERSAVMRDALMLQCVSLVWGHGCQP